MCPNFNACLQRLLDYIKPTQVHVMKAGQIILSGGIEVAGEYSVMELTAAAVCRRADCQ